MPLRASEATTVEGGGAGRPEHAADERIDDAGTVERIPRQYAEIL